MCIIISSKCPACAADVQQPLSDSQGAATACRDSGRFCLSKPGMHLLTNVSSKYSQIHTDMHCKILKNTVRYSQICTAFKNECIKSGPKYRQIHKHMHCLYKNAYMYVSSSLTACMSAELECSLYTCTYALDIAPMSQDTYEYSQMYADTCMCISDIQYAYVIFTPMYYVHVRVHIYGKLQLFPPFSHYREKSFPTFPLFHFPTFGAAVI